ncbi:FMN-dependent NADH-azoreductase [Occultella aeris]|uniref:FMN dependent NADH:quinone oxidoreductase n=1 Tax=Occultella aeris TaxID=2761496 RepID=A0A7M4DJ21_9MICO|nr:NAD(P)H-dependent oxidoreductase [Occultella aeris]VZO37004.1 FMN-dependent NADH-azoreductase 1 [Occultella aeris]
MPTLFRLDASIRFEGSHSSRIADIVESEWRAQHPDGAVATRHLGRDPIPADAWPQAAFAPPTGRSTHQQRAVDLATELADELLAADVLLLAVPLYNFGVSQHFKTWTDLALTDPRLAPGDSPSLAGKRAVLATVRGGAYGAGTPREGWDHATPWMRRILEDVWNLDLDVVETEFTLVGTNPALDQFSDLAARMHAEAEELAHEYGRALAKGARAAA